MHLEHGMDVNVRGPFFKSLQRTFPISNNKYPHRACSSIQNTSWAFIWFALTNTIGTNPCSKDFFLCLLHHYLRQSHPSSLFSSLTLLRSL